MSTLRVSNIEAKADPSSPTVDEQVKITNSNGDVLLYVDGRTSGITTVGINTTAEVFKVDAYKNFEYSGIITAASFSGPISASTGTYSGDVIISGNLGVAGTITYEDVARVDATGISTFREGFKLGPLTGIALTAYADGSIRSSGIVTAITGSFAGDLIIGNDGTNYGNAAVQSFSAHGNTAGESGLNSIDTTSVAAGVGGEISFHGKYNTGAQDYAYLGHIRGTKENATAGNTACALKFFTRPNGTAPQERLRITSAGKVGINTTTASSTLQIYGANDGEGTATGQITLKDTANYNATPTGGVVFQGHHTAQKNSQAIFSGIRGFKENTTDGNYAGALAFDVRKHGAVAYEALRIGSNGSLGVSHTLSGTADYNRLMLHNPHDGSCWMQMTSTASGNAANTDGLSIGLNSSNVAHIWQRENADMVFATNGTERMKIHSAGYVTKTNHVAFFAYANMSWTNLNGGDKVQFDTLVNGTWGNSNVNSNGYDTSNDRFVAPVAGLYQFTVAMYMNSNNMNNILSICPRIDGSQLSNGNDTVFFWSVRQNTSTTDGNTYSGSLQLYLNANQYVEVYRRTGGSGTHQYYGRHSHFCGHLIG